MYSSGVLLLAFGLVCGAAAIGAALAVIYLRAKPAPAAALALHAAVGAAGLAILVLALRRGLPQTGMGTAGFGPTAAVLLALTLAFGLRIAWLGWRRRRPSEILVGTHALAAVSALVLLLSVVALG